MSKLLTPMTFANGQQAPNRLWLAPMTNGQSHDDGRLSDDELRWLLQRARGGFSVIESCATHVSQEGQGWEGELGIFDDAHIPGWTRLADAIHDHDALLIAQIFHGGCRAMVQPDGPYRWSASEIQTDDGPVRAATDEDIEGVIDAFADAARRAHQAGADGVELHGAHGYLLCQFLSTDTNRRTDQWGGSIDHRARLIRRTLQACRAATDDDFIIGARLSPENFGDLQGLDLDESLQVAQWLADDGADFIHISLWDAAQNTSKYPDQHPATLFRDALPDDVPLITAGQVWTHDDALAQLDRGADAVALGRGAIANPAWPKRVAKDGEDPTRPPLSEEALLERGLNQDFVDYMRNWPGFVEDTD